MTQHFSKSSVFICIVSMVAFSGCLTPGLNNSNSSTHYFYAHCINPSQTAVLDVAGDTGIAATGSSAAVDGDANLSENTNLCQSQWAPVKVQTVTNASGEGLSIYTGGTSSVIFNMDFTPYNNNPSAASVQTTGVIESGFLYGTTMNCTLYNAQQINGTGCGSNTTIASCPNLGWNICSD